MKKIERYREGDAIPDGAKFIESTTTREHTGRYEYGGPRNLIDFLVFAEYSRPVMRTVKWYLYEVEV